MKPTFLSEQSNYLWLLKPTFLNRGRGIHVFSDLKTLEKIIKDYADGYFEKPVEEKKEEPPANEQIWLQKQSSKQKKPETINSFDGNQYIRVIP